MVLLAFFSDNAHVDLGININNNILFSNSNHDLMSESTIICKKCKIFLIFGFLCGKIAPDAHEKCDGGIAQLVEQLTFNQWVQGSSPCASTRNKNALLGVFYFCVFNLNSHFLEYN